MRRRRDAAQGPRRARRRPAPPRRPRLDVRLCRLARRRPGPRGRRLRRGGRAREPADLRRSPGRARRWTRCTRAADLLVLPSRSEPYGMVVTEALARGVPVLASRWTASRRPWARTVRGCSSRPGTPPRSRRALRRWLTEPALRERLRAGAADRRRGLQPWSGDGGALAAALDAATTGSAPVTRFSPDWLALREPADAAARSAELAAAAARAVDPDRLLVVHDLGCGTGSMGRWLAPRLPGPQAWVLHDHDAELAAQAAQSLPVPATVAVGDLADLQPRDVDGAGSRHRFGAARRAHRRGAAGRRRGVCRRPLARPAHPVGAGTGRARPAGPARRPRRGRVRRAPAPGGRVSCPAGPGRRRCRGARVRRARRRGGRAAEPVATRPVARGRSRPRGSRDG